MNGQGQGIESLAKSDPNLAQVLWGRIRRFLEPESGKEVAGLIGASMVPGVGSALDLADVAAGIQDRDALRTGIGLLATMLPVSSSSLRAILRNQQVIKRLGKEARAASKAGKTSEAMERLNLLRKMHHEVQGPVPPDLWHGSPARFNKFDMDFLSTGEGGQVMTPGHYFGQAKGTGQRYLEQLSSRDVEVTFAHPGGEALSTVNVTHPGHADRAAVDFHTYQDEQRRLQQTLEDVLEEHGVEHTIHDRVLEDIINRSDEFPKERMSDVVKNLKQVYDEQAEQWGFEIGGRWAGLKGPRMAADARKAALDDLAQVIDEVKVNYSGKLYNVDVLAEDAKFLDLERPMREQWDLFKNALPEESFKALDKMEDALAEAHPSLKLEILRKRYDDAWGLWNGLPPKGEYRPSRGALLKPEDSTYTKVIRRAVPKIAKKHGLDEDTVYGWLGQPSPTSLARDPYTATKPLKRELKAYDELIESIENSPEKKALDKLGEEITALEGTLRTWEREGVNIQIRDPGLLKQWDEIKLKRALKNLAEEYDRSGQDAKRFITDWATLFRNMGGYERAEYARHMASRGIPGLKFLDQFSRYGKQAGERTYNYVVYDDNILDIINKRWGGIVPLLRRRA